MRLFSFLLCALLSTPALAAAPPDIPGGTLLGDDGAPIPLLQSDAELSVSGDIVTAELTQVFKSSRPVALHARYLFPLPHDAAVYALTLTVGGVVTEARIQRLEEAKQTFEAAKREGKTAALLEQHRPNVFTQDIANIPPGESVEVKIRYAATVPRLDGQYELHFPMVVGSRYSNGKNGIEVPELSKPLPSGATHETDPRLSSAPPANPGARVSLRVHLRAGLPIQSLASPSHGIEVDSPAPDQREVMLARGRVPDDRDFVLKYALSGADTAAAMLIHDDERGAYYSMLLEPKRVVREEEIQARELVFVLDASCSMAGAPLELSKALVNRMLELARPSDRYRVIVFGSSATELNRGALAPTPENLAETRAQLAALPDQGGTEIELALKAALSPKVEGNRLRMVLFLTDGFIGDEASVMATIRAQRTGARLFSFGVGDSVNRWLLEEMAIAGSGVSRIVTLSEDPRQVVERLSLRLDAPILTDAWVDFGNLAATETTPAGTLDLFRGEAVRVLGRLPRGTKPEQIEAELVGKAGGREVRIPLQVRRAAAGGAAGAIPVLWARAQVGERMRAFTRPGARGAGTDVERARLIEEITQLGLRYAISTQWTAFVAVSERVVPGPAAQANVPLPQPHGVSTGFFGESTPEPAEWAAMLLLMAMAGAVLWRQGRSPRSS